MRFHYICRDKHIDLFPKTFAVEKIGIMEVKYGRNTGKIQLLLKIAHRLNEAGVEWALGASMMLYFKDITSDFHDIDLMVVDRDAECVRTILSEMGESCSSDFIPNLMYRTKTFMEFRIDSVEVDVNGWLLQS